MMQERQDSESSRAFAGERARIVGALGEMADAGMVEDVRHIGATRLLENENAGCVDLAVAAYPLDETLDAKLEALGYAPDGEFENAPVKRFRHVSGAFRVWAIESGDKAWGEWIATRDYLLHDAGARREYAAERAAWAGDAARKERFFREAWGSADKWWVSFHGFEPVRNLARELAGLAVPWYVSSGWALDLFLGRVTRLHHDLDIVVARADQLALHEYMTARGWRFVTPFEKRFSVWGPHMRLEAPRHQAHAHRNGAFLDFLLTDIENGIWKYRREPSIVQAMERVAMKTPEGIPFLAPEVVLLFKSQNTSHKERDKDGTDFEAVVSHLEPVRRAWLRWALYATAPEHPWLDALR